MNPKYKAEDHAIVDYDYQVLPGSGRDGVNQGVYFRGPAPLNLAEGGYIACIGGSQTLGRFVERPYPRLVAEALGMQALNLGHGGGKPQYFLQSPGVLEHVNKASFAIVQIMTARGVASSAFEPADIHSAMMWDKRPGGASGKVFADVAYRRLVAEESPDRVAAVLAEIRSSWLREMGALLQAILVPKILLWFSTRDPDSNAGFRDPKATQPNFPWFVYPHFVNRSMVNVLRPMVSGYVEYVGHPGMPQALRSRFDGSPVHVFRKRERDTDLNKYYPSPEMHAAAASLLVETFRRLPSLIHTCAD